MLAIGEIRTGLLQNSTAVPAALTTRALALLPGELVRSSERPIAYAVSPERLTGLDCRLPTRSRARARGVGTAVTRAAITGGRVLQASTRTVLMRAGTDRRLPWAHYLARPGVVEVTGRAGFADVADGYLGVPQQSTLDLAALNERLFDDIVMRPELDRRPPFRVARTTLRWVAEVADEPAVPVRRPPRPAGDGDGAGDGPAQAQFWLAGGTLRTARLALPADHLPMVVELCEDLALHDWLLTTVTGLIERGRPDAAPGSVADTAAVQRIRPAVDHLLHLWMPAARVDRRLLPLWESLERRPGFTRQWDVSVSRIRDQIALTTVGLLGIVAEGITRA
ncbi:MAG: hypothetical protein V7637_1797 [Mycobacteriales bacterium]|jgi:hypothetical protein